MNLDAVKTFGLATAAMRRKASYRQVTGVVRLGSLLEVEVHKLNHET
jgi:hypothetical protein